MRGSKIRNQIEIRDLLYQIYGNIYLFFTRGEPRPFEMSKIFSKIFSKNIFEKYFFKISTAQFYTNFGTFCTKSTVTYIYFSQEGNHDLLKWSKIKIKSRFGTFCKIYGILTRGELRPFEMSKYFLKNIFTKYFSQDFDSPILHEFRDLLYRIYGNIYLFFTRGELRPFEMSKNIFKNIFVKNIFKIFLKIFFKISTAPFYTSFGTFCTKSTVTYIYFSQGGELRPFEMSKNILWKYFSKNILWKFHISTAPFQSSFGTFCTKSTVTYIYFSERGIFWNEKYFEKYFWKYFQNISISTAHISKSNFGTFCTKSTVTYIYFSQEGNHDLLKCITKNIFKNILWRIFSEKYFQKIFSEKYFSENISKNFRKIFQNRDFGTFCTKSTVTYIYFSQEGNHDLLKGSKNISKSSFGTFCTKSTVTYIYLSQGGELRPFEMSKIFSKIFFCKKYFHKIYFHKGEARPFDSPISNRDSGPFVPNLR